METVGNKRIEEMIVALYGDRINEFSRGSETMTHHAIDVCVPAVVAITLPEEYVSIVLTSRMDNELRKLLERMLHRQGKPDELLFGCNHPFGTFSSKIDGAYSFGFLTKKMHDALTCCRKLRNAFAHSDNPDEAKESKDYKHFRNRLLNLDRPYVSKCVEDFKALRTNCGRDLNELPGFSELVAVMLAITELLGSAAFGASFAQSKLLRHPCAYFGYDDVPGLNTMSKP